MRWIFCGWHFLMATWAMAEVDPGGASPISSTAPDRARQAIARVTPGLKEKAKELGLTVGKPVYLRLFKEEDELELWLQKPNAKDFALFKTYRIATWGGGTLGPKLRQGDGQAPEGFYYFNSKGLNPQSNYHLSMNLGYPNAFDRAHDRTGDFLMIHGHRVSIGCYAMTDRSIEEIYTLCKLALDGGQPYVRAHAFPFRMTAERLAKEAANPNHAFWTNLKEGYDAFEKSKVPPEVSVSGKRYVVK